MGYRTPMEMRRAGRSAEGLLLGLEEERDEEAMDVLWKETRSRIEAGMSEIIQVCKPASSATQAVATPMRCAEGARATRRQAKGQMP